VAAALVGAVARLLVYTRGVSLWNDEAMLALNIGRRGLLELLTPLDYDQTAPVLYLWATRLATAVGGVNEYTLRLPAFVAALILPFALWHIGRRIVGEPSAAVATALAAFSPTLIEFGNQVKPYSSDALVALLIVWLAWRVREDPANRNAWIALAVGGVVAMLASYPAAFVLAACGLFLVASPGVIESAGRGMPLLVAATWAFGGAVIYISFMRVAAASAYLHNFWEGTFLTPSAHDFRLRAYLAAQAFTSVLPIRPELLRPRLLIPVFLLGLVALWRQRGRAVAALCVAALLAACAASAAGRYPMSARLLLFASPFIFLVIGSAVASTLSPVERRWTGATAVAALLLPVAMLGIGLTRLWSIQANTEGRGAVTVIMSARGHEPVYVAPGAVSLWAFYSTNWSRPETRYLDSVARLASSGGVAFSSGPSRHGPVNAEEGRTLVFERRGTSELIGVHTGNPYTEPTGLVGVAPDSGWAQTEASRLLATCASHVWIMSAVRVKGETGPLLRALRSAGARVVYRFDELEASAVRVVLPPRRVTSCTGPPAIVAGVASTATH
jgi:hypothetical protein